MELSLLYADDEIVVCIKPPRVLSTDEPGGMPELLRRQLTTDDVRTVHRLDRVVGGLMVFARNAACASELSRQIRENTFEKTYLAVVHGTPEYDVGEFYDLLFRNKARKMTEVVLAEGKGVQPASLSYCVLNKAKGMSRVRIQLQTGRTHQIRVQFASRNMPLVGERKYSTLEDGCEIALWSHRLCFTHPTTGEKMQFVQQPPKVYPWTDC